MRKGGGCVVSGDANAGASGLERGRVGHSLSAHNDPAGRAELF